MRKKSEEQRQKPLNLKKWLVALAVFVLLLVTLCILKTNQSVCEFFARTISRAWVWLFGNVLGWIPVSFYELLVAAAVIGVIVALVMIIVFLKRRQGKHALKIVVVIAVLCIGFASVYTATASTLYNRAEMPLGSKDFTVSDQELFEACEYYVTLFNEVSARLERDENGIVKNPYTIKQLGDKLQEDFRCLDSFDGYFSPFTPQAKGMATSFAVSAFSLTGITFIPFGEPNVNVENPACDLPHTMAHEMAHSKGVMREYQANIVANYVCLNSSDDFILYSGLRNTVYTLISIYQIQTPSDGQRDFYAMLDPAIGNENLAEWDFWWGKHTFVSKISDWFNDLYLKINGQSGTGSYIEPPPVVEPTPPPDDPETPYPPQQPQVVSYSVTQRLMLEMYRNRMAD